jgi:hypothetical protein
MVFLPRSCSRTAGGWMMVTVIGSTSIVAVADCEALRDGLLRQPVNAGSSLTLLAAGLWMLLQAARRGPGRRGELAAFGTGMSIAGVGSVLLHGPDPTWALWFHDLSGMAVLLIVLVLNIGLLMGWALQRRLLLVAIVLVPLGPLLAILPTSTVPIAWVLVPAAALSELMVLRYRARPTSSFPVRPWTIAVVAIALAGAAYLLGRSGSPYCHPESDLQWHAVWHVLVAVSATAFASAAFGGATGPGGAARRASRIPGGAART